MNPHPTPTGECLCILKGLGTARSAGVASPGAQKLMGLALGLVICLLDIKPCLTNEKEQAEIVNTTKVTRFGSLYRVTKRELIIV